jgi:hypothetical protein
MLRRRLDTSGGVFYSERLARERLFFGQASADVAQLAEQLICNQ